MNVAYLDGHVNWVKKGAFATYALLNPTAIYSTVIVKTANKEY